MAQNMSLPTEMIYNNNVNNIGQVFGYSDKLDSRSNTHFTTHLETLIYKMKALFNTITNDIFINTVLVQVIIKSSASHES